MHCSRETLTDYHGSIIYFFFKECYPFPIVTSPHKCAQLNGFGQHDALTAFLIVLLQGRY